MTSSRASSKEHTPPPKRRCVSRSASVIGSIQKVITAPLTWLARSPSSGLEDARGKRRRSVSPTDSDKEGQEARAKKARVHSPLPTPPPSQPTQQSQPGYLDMPESLIAPPMSAANQPQALGRSASLSIQSDTFRAASVPSMRPSQLVMDNAARPTAEDPAASFRPRYGGGLRMMSMEPVDRIRASSALPDLEQGRKRKYAADPPTSYISRSRSVSRGISRDVSMGPPPVPLFPKESLNSVSFTVQPRQSITPQPTEQTSGAGPSTIGQENPELPQVSTLMTHPRFLRAPTEPIPEEPPATLGELAESYRRSQPPSARPSAIARAESMPSLSAAEAKKAEKELRGMRIFRAPLVPSRLRQEFGQAHGLQLKQSLPPTIVMQKEKAKEEVPIEGVGTSTGTTSLGLRERGAVKLLTRRHVGYGGLERERSESSSSHGSENLVGSESAVEDLIVVEDEVFEVEEPLMQLPSSAEAPDEAMEDLTGEPSMLAPKGRPAGRVGRVRSGQKETPYVRPPKKPKKSVFSAIEEEEREEQEQERGKEKEKEKEVIEEVGGRREPASLPPRYQPPSGFSFAKKTAPSEEAPVPSLPFSFATPPATGVLSVSPVPEQVESRANLLSSAFAQVNKNIPTLVPRVAVSETFVASAVSPATAVLESASSIALTPLTPQPAPSTTQPTQPAAPSVTAPPPASVGASSMWSVTNVSGKQPPTSFFQGNIAAPDMSAEPKQTEGGEPSKVPSAPTWGASAGGFLVSSLPSSSSAPTAVSGVQRTSTSSFSFLPAPIPASASSPAALIGSQTKPAEAPSSTSPSFIFGAPAKPTEPSGTSHAPSPPFLGWGTQAKPTERTPAVSPSTFGGEVPVKPETATPAPPSFKLGPPAEIKATSTTAVLSLPGLPKTEGQQVVESKLAAAATAAETSGLPSFGVASGAPSAPTSGTAEPSKTTFFGTSAFSSSMQFPQKPSEGPSTSVSQPVSAPSATSSTSENIYRFGQGATQPFSFTFGQSAGASTGGRGLGMQSAFGGTAASLSTAAVPTTPPQDQDMSVDESPARNNAMDLNGTEQKPSKINTAFPFTSQAASGGAPIFGNAPSLSFPAPSGPSSTFGAQAGQPSSSGFGQQQPPPPPSSFGQLSAASQPGLLFNATAASGSGFGQTNAGTTPSPVAFGQALFGTTPTSATAPSNPFNFSVSQPASPATGDNGQPLAVGSSSAAFQFGQPQEGNTQEPALFTMGRADENDKLRRPVKGLPRGGRRRGPNPPRT